MGQETGGGTEEEGVGQKRKVVGREKKEETGEKGCQTGEEVVGQERIGGGTGGRGWDMRGRRWDSRKIPHLDSPIVDSQLGGELRYPEKQATVMFVSVIILYLETVTGGGDFCLLESWAPPVRALLMAFSSSTLKAPTGILDGVTGRRSASNSERRTWGEKV